MAIQVSAEVNDDGLILFAFSYPGSCGWGANETTALERLRADISFTTEWLASHDLPVRVNAPLPPDVEVDITERVPSTGRPRQCDTEGFFAVDRQPFANADLSNTKMLLGASRSDVLDLTTQLDDDVLEYRLEEDRRTIREILDHIALAEHWYLTRVDVPYDVPNDWNTYPPDTYPRLEAIRRDVTGSLETLVQVPEERRVEQWMSDGERWSITKVLRRLVWHELLHYKQLVRLVPKVNGESNG